MTITQTSADVRITQLPLTGRRNGRNGVVIGRTLVIDDDFTRSVLLPLRWCFGRRGYVCRGAGRAAIYLHQAVFRHYHGAVPPGLEIDHIDRNPLNNMPANLRAVTRSVNIANGRKRRNNTLGFVGVEMQTSKTGWRYFARIMVSGVRISLGGHATAREAARAVNRAYRQHRPEVAVPNPGVE